MKKNFLRIVSFAFVFILLFLSSGDLEATKAKKPPKMPEAEGTNFYVKIGRIGDSPTQFGYLRAFYVEGEVYCSLHELASHLNEGLDPFNVVWNPAKKRTEIRLHEKYTGKAPEWKSRKEKILIHWASADLWIGEKSKKFTGFVHEKQFFVPLKQVANYVGFSYKFETDGWEKIIILSTKVPDGIMFDHEKGCFPLGSTVPYIERWTVPKRNFLYEEDGKYIHLHVVEKNNLCHVMKDTYAKNWTKLESKELPFFGEKFGGFLAGKNYNYLVFGQDNPNEDDRRDVYTVIKTDKNFKEIARAGIRDCYTIKPFDFGSVSLAEFGDYLILHTSRLRYLTPDGLNHQSQFSAAIDIPSMRVLTDELGKFQKNHVSHSFNQFALFDQNGTAFLIDHGDAYPRSIQVLKMDPSLNGVRDKVDLFRIPGKIGANQTGVSIGDVIQTEQDIVIGLNMIDYTKATSFDSYKIEGKHVDLRDVLLLFVNKNTLRIRGEKLTNYDENKKMPSFSVPYILKVGENRLLVMWMKTLDNKEVLQYQLFDLQGNKLSSVKEKPRYYLSNMKPIYDDGKVFWIYPATCWDGSSGRNIDYNVIYRLDIGDVQR